MERDAKNISHVSNLKKSFKRLEVLKDTSILSVIGFPELVNTAKNVQANTFMSFQTWAIVGIMYLIVITILSRSAKAVERRLDIGQR